MALEELTNGLNAWVNEPSRQEGENRDAARDRIIECRKNKSTSLDLKSLGLRSIPKEIGSLVYLEWLNLSNNQIKEIPDAIGRLVNLKSLNLSNNQIKEIPDAIGRLVNLEWLFLYANQITKIPAAIEILVNLKSLFLSSNQIKEIPDAIGGLVNLKELTLHSNLIKEIPDAIGRLVNLKSLNLSKNQITQIPDAIGRLVKLQMLDFSENPSLIFTPELIDQLSNLENLGCDVRYPIHFNPFAAQAREKLDAICLTQRKEDEPDFVHVKEVLKRFLSEGIVQRSNALNQKERGQEIAQSALPTLEILEKNPHLLPLVNEISARFLDGCVNQPVRGWSEISALMAIAAKENFTQKLEATKQVFALDYIAAYVREEGVGSAVEVEAGNALYREVHKELKEPWLGVPGPIAHEGFIKDFLTPDRIKAVARNVKDMNSLTLEELKDRICNSEHNLAWGEICFPAQIQEIKERFKKDLEDLGEEVTSEQLEEINFQKKSVISEEVKRLTMEQEARPELDPTKLKEPEKQKEKENLVDATRPSTSCVSRYFENCLSAIIGKSSKISPEEQEGQTTR